jgi:hypothetical protein
MIKELDVGGRFSSWHPIVFRENIHFDAFGY